jgi:hypothetical protein
VSVRARRPAAPIEGLARGNMRRSFDAIALLVPLVLAACGNGKQPGATARPGTPGQLFKVTVFRSVGGTITSADGKIRCGTAGAGCSAEYGWDDQVTLSATPDAGFKFELWAGDCSDDGACVLSTRSTGADKYVIASFTSGTAAHGTWTNPIVHGAQYEKFLAWRASGTPTPASGTRDCTNGGCHGPRYEGVGIAPSCNECHQRQGGASGGWSGLAPIGSVCSNCHGTFGMTTSASYHHPMSGAAPTGYPGPADALACQSCHVKHELWTPTTKGFNLRASVTGDPPSPADSDVGACGSCHATTQAKKAPGLDDGTLATPALDVSAYRASAHAYQVAGSFGGAGNAFSASCAKCHNGSEDTTYQDGVARFAVHGSPDRRLRAALGRPALVDDDAEGFCFRCHSNQGDAIAGAKKGADANDWYDTAGVAMAAGATDVYTQAQKGTPARLAGPSTATALSFKPPAEETVSSAVTGLAATADPFNAAANTLYLSTTSSGEPTPNAYLLSSSVSGTVSAATLFFQGTTTSVAGLTVPQAGDALANTAGSLRTMDLAAGSSTFANVNLNSTGTNRFFHVTSFTSSQVSSSVIPAGSWSVTVTGRKQGNGNANTSVTALTRAYLYVWQANNTKVAVAGPANEGTPLGNSNSNRTVTFTGVPPVTLASGDRLVVDVEAQVTNTVTGGSLQYSVGSASALGVPAPINLPFVASYNTTTYRNTALNLARGTASPSNRNSNTTAGLVGWDRVSQFVTPPLVTPFTLRSGSAVNLNVRTSQTNPGNGCFVQFAAYRWTSGDTQGETIGVLANGEASSGVSIPMPTSAGLQTLTLVVPADVSFAPNDKLLVEVQVYKNPTNTAANGCTVAYGGTDGSNLSIVSADGATMQFGASPTLTPWAAYSMSPGASSGSDLSVGAAQTAAGGNLRQLWKRASFVSPPVRTATTLTAAPWGLDVCGSGSNANVEARARYRFFVWNANNTIGPDILPWTTDGLLPGAPGLQAITTPAGAPVPLAVGDRIVTELEVETTSAAGGAATNAFTFGKTSPGKVTLPSAVEFTYPEVDSPSWGRHDVAAYRGVHRPNPAEETPAYLGANKHVECEDCHNPHVAGKTAHVLGTNAIATDSPLAGVSGAEPVFSAGTFVAAGAYTQANATKESFRNAPLRGELLRPATGAPARTTIRTRTRVGILGSPQFHTGLLVVVLAGVARLLVGADAAREAMEQDLLPAGPDAFERQDQGLLAAPVSLPAPVLFRRLVPTHYANGELLGLSAEVELDGAPRSLAVNAPLDVGTTRLYLTQSFGPVAFVEIAHGGSTTRRAAVLRPSGAGDFEYAEAKGSLRLLLRAPPIAGQERPREEVDVRVLEDGAMLAAARLRVGEVLRLPSGGSVALHGVRWWARLLASRDPTAWPIFAGFGVAIVGLLLLVAFVRVDTLVKLELAGVNETLTVAMRPRRFAVLYADEFERLIERASREG